jgi:radical SAM-linked protein
LPLAYSQGFHPQPRINLASALPLGFTSECEIADVWLEQSIPTAEARAALEQALPPGIQIQEIQEVEEKAPALQTQVIASEYVITLMDPQPSPGATPPRPAGRGKPAAGAARQAL